jgi:hypothetical protein
MGGLCLLPQQRRGDQCECQSNEGENAAKTGEPFGISGHDGYLMLIARDYTNSAQKMSLRFDHPYCLLGPILRAKKKNHKVDA